MGSGSAGGFLASRRKTALVLILLTVVSQLVAVLYGSSLPLPLELAHTILSPQFCVCDGMFTEEIGGV